MDWKEKLVEELAWEFVDAIVIDPAYEGGGLINAKGVNGTVHIDDGEHAQELVEAHKLAIREAIDRTVKQCIEFIEDPDSRPARVDGSAMYRIDSGLLTATAPIDLTSNRKSTT